MAHVEFGPRVEKDLRAARAAGELDRLKAAIAGLAAEELGQGLDIVPLIGASPWRRMRAGNWRILLRPLTEEEMRRLHRTGRGYLIARVVNRRDLERAVQSLGA